jgi:hypothetical protein
MNLEGLLSEPPKLHGRDGATTDGWRLDDAGLLFLDARVKAGMRTIETGAGVSTIAFALKRAEHTCVAPHGASGATYDPPGCARRLPHRASRLKQCSNVFAA